jgi:hypothetical protein
MKQFALLSAVFALLLAAAAARAGDAPTSFPSLDQPVRTALAVAQLGPGTALPQFSECGQHGDRITVCIDGPPFWTEATVLATVFGIALPPTLYLATTSHYGVRDYLNRPYLVAIKTDGKQFIMPKYAHLELVRNKQGDLYFLLRSPHPAWWLPCNVNSLREEIDSRDFDHFQENTGIDVGTYSVTKFPELFRVTGKRAVPRFGVAINRLREHLAMNAVQAEELACNPAI